MTSIAKTPEFLSAPLSKFEKGCRLVLAVVHFLDPLTSDFLAGEIGYAGFSIDEDAQAFLSQLTRICIPIKIKLTFLPAEDMHMLTLLIIDLIQALEYAAECLEQKYGIDMWANFPMDCEYFFSQPEIEN